MSWQYELDNLVTEVLRDGISVKELWEEFEASIIRYMEQDGQTKDNG